MGYLDSTKALHQTQTTTTRTTTKIGFQPVRKFPRIIGGPVVDEINSFNSYYVLNLVLLCVSSPPCVLISARAIVRVHVQPLPQPGGNVITTHVWPGSICLQQSYHIHIYKNTMKMSIHMTQVQLGHQIIC